MKLPLQKDPMGQAIRVYHQNGKSEKLWVYSDISEIDEIPLKYLFRAFKDMPHIEKAALQNCVGSVLDVGAAAGSHSLWLSKNKRIVCSIDISKLAVETMKDRGVADARWVDFFQMPKTQKFDTLLFLMNGIGIAGSISGLSQFFEKCRELLTKGGQVLLDSSDINYMFDEDDEKPINKYYGEVKYIMRYEDVISDKFEWLFIDFETLKTEAHKDGFQCEKLVEGEQFDYLAKLTIK